MTLGCLREGRELSLAEALTLHDLCARSQARLRAWTFRPSHCSSVSFHCRSLERLVSRDDVPLAIPTSDAKNRVVQALEADLVDSVLRPFSPEGMCAYLPAINKPGNRETHYRGNHSERTLVCFLSELPAVVAEFKRDVDTALPNTYVWFDALHMTVRAL